MILFVLDVAVRRVDIDREEWAKAWRKVRAALGWGDVQRAVAGQESLGALLNRRDQVRETRATAAPVVDERLFQPRGGPAAPIPPSGAGSGSSPAGVASAHGTDSGAGPQADSAAADPRSGTTSRLLEAKRRARRN